MDEDKILEIAFKQIENGEHDSFDSIEDLIEDLKKRSKPSVDGFICSLNEAEAECKVDQEITDDKVSPIFNTVKELTESLDLPPSRDWIANAAEEILMAPRAFPLNANMYKDIIAKHHSELQEQYEAMAVELMTAYLFDDLEVVEDWRDEKGNPPKWLTEAAERYNSRQKEKHNES